MGETIRYFQCGHDTPRLDCEREGRAILLGTPRSHGSLELAISKDRLSGAYFYVVVPHVLDKRWTTVSVVWHHPVWEHWVNDSMVLSSKGITRVPEL